MGAKYEAYIESEADGLDISVLAVVPDETPYSTEESCSLFMG